MSGMLTRLVLTIGFLSAIALSPADARLGGFGAAMVMKDGVLYVGGPGDYPFFPMPASRPGSVHLFIPGEAGGDFDDAASVRSGRSDHDAAVVGMRQSASPAMTSPSTSPTSGGLGTAGDPGRA